MFEYYCARLVKVCKRWLLILPSSDHQPSSFYKRLCASGLSSTEYTEQGILRALERTLDGLPEEDLAWQPNPDCNSIGWLVWHLTRAQDSVVSNILGEEQLWIKDGWHTKFGRPPEATDSGVGHTPQDLAAFKSPDSETLLG
jgi:hypothetical protein